MTKKSPAKTTKKPNKYTQLIAPISAVLVVAIGVYFFVVRPSQPEYVLQKAFSATFDRTKNTSGRYSGTYGVKDEKVAVEFSGQLKGEDSSMLTSIDFDGAKSTVELIKSTDTYVKFTGTESINQYIQTLSNGARSISEPIKTLMTAQENKWIRVSDNELSVLSDALGCTVSNDSSSLQKTFDELQKDLPFRVAGGAYRDDGDGTITRITVALKDPEQFKKSAFYSMLESAGSCLSKLRESDYKTRQVNSQDLAAWRADIYIDQSTSTVTRILIKQFDMYFQVFLKDFNKDIVISAPKDTVSLQNIAETLPIEDRLKLLQGIGL